MTKPSKDDILTTISNSLKRDHQENPFVILVSISMSNKRRFLVYCKELIEIIKQYTIDTPVYISIDSHDRINIFSNHFTDIYKRIEAEEALLKCGNNYAITPPIKCFDLTQLSLNPGACDIPTFILNSLSEFILFADIDVLKGISTYLESTHKIIEAAITLFINNVDGFVKKNLSETEREKALMAIDSSTKVIAHFANTSGLLSTDYISTLIRQLPSVTGLKHEDLEIIRTNLANTILALNANKPLQDHQLLAVLHEKGLDDEIATLTAATAALGISHNARFLSPQVASEPKQPTAYIPSSAAAKQVLPSTQSIGANLTPQYNS